MGSDLLSINLVTDTKTFSISFDNSTTAEEVCISLCKYIGVSPVARHIFALQDAQKKHFLIPSANFSKKYLSYNFRIRFKVVNIARLKDMDLKAYEYYFHQARCDVLNNNIPDLIYDKHKTELLGLGITDMYRVMLEKGLSREVVENDYKKYIPKEVIKQHMFFIKKPISDHLSKIKKVGYNASYVKMEYLKQLDLMVPEYLAEDYKALTDQNGIVYNVFIRVSPYHPTLPGIRISFDPKRENWQQICSIQDICYISLRQDGTVEISRKNGIPYYLKFFTFSVMLSFVSLLDGYYRLSCKWIFNICKDVATPSLQQLYATKCHGPVGGEFSYAKLEDKRDNRAGCFILRESELKYGTYYIDVCVKNNKIPKTYKLEKMTNDEFVFSNDLTKYNSIQQLVHAYSDPQGEIYLYDCLPPSEYDKSPLLLCHNDHISSDFLTESSDTMPSAPLCINSHNLQVYKGKKCLRWNKARTKIKYKDSFIKQDTFEKEMFPDNNINEAKKFCRNPNGNVAGPWCYVESEDSDMVEQELCDIPFCDEEDCTFFSKDNPTYSHYLRFNDSLTNLTFGLKAWSSDSILNASARLILAVLPLPLNAKQIEDIGIGIEIHLTNKLSALTFGNKDEPEYYETHDVLKSTRFTFLSLTWSKGFITLSKHEKSKPIFVAQYKTKKNLLGYMKNSFFYYATRSTNILWSMPFCDDDGDCDVHTTTSLKYQNFWLLREHNLGYDLHFYVRAFHSAHILLVSNPLSNFPYIEIMFDRLTNNNTQVVSVEYEGAPKTLHIEYSFYPLLNYWKWTEFSISFFSNTLQVYLTNEVGTHMIMELKHDLFRKMRWFSPSSENTVAHWTFYCNPPPQANEPEAWPPECTLHSNEFGYKGSQWITYQGFPCLPWSGIKLLPESAAKAFSTSEAIKSINYCRNPDNKMKGTYCYTIDQKMTTIKQVFCHIRQCKSTECKMAGTGNDYIGKQNITRSNRNCTNWIQFIVNNNITHNYLNETLYADMSVEHAENFCRNPSRDIAGPWCYTTQNGTKDICNIRDCNKPEECTILLNGNNHGQKKDDLRGITTTYRCLWKVTKTKKIEVAMKMLKNDKSETHLKGFLDLAGNWAFLNSSSIVRLYGVTMINPVSMILEHVRLGPLNEYLRNNRSIVKPVDLIEACSHLASALWHLEENGTVHGNIRCRKLLVSYHDENKFIVKLGDPGVHHSYDRNEIHWIPTECYSNFEFARKSTSADVWAFATTVWEIFTYGSPINSFEYNDAIKWYTSGRRLPQPSDCPNNIFKILKECWNVDPHRRKQPQAIMRDVNQILYQVYNSRRIHSYAKINAKTDLESRNSSACSIATNSTELSSIDDYQDELLSIHDKDKVDDKFNSSSNSEVDSKFSNFLLDMNQENNDDDVFSNDLSNTFSNFTFSTSITSVDSISSMQSIFELDADCNVILQGRVGQGFYGEVYKATMENLGDKDCQPKLVAVKKLKTSAANTCIQDFEREISIMKTLKHPNIVEILGVLQEPEVSLVMEYVQHGSLQSYLKIYRETLSTKQLLKYSLDIALGMDYLGTKHIVHRDLAARNILVVNESHVKISDFGLAQVMGTNEYYILKTNRELPIKWYAPESLRDGKFSSASDVWSYGVTMCEMFGHGEEPNLHINHNEKEEQEQQLLLNAIESGARFPCPSVCPQSVYVCLIYPCWKGNPHERPSFFQLCKKSEELLLQY